MVALDLELSDDLRREGSARELVHHVQALRRSAGLDVTDRIELGLASTDAGVASIIESFGPRLAAEVLANDIRSSDVEGAGATGEIELDGARVRLSLRKA